MSRQRVLGIFIFLFAGVAMGQTAADDLFIQGELESATTKFNSHALPKEIVIGKGLKALSFLLLTEPPTGRGTSEYDLLTPEEKNEFHQTRIKFLTRLLSVLSYARLGFGAGVTVGNTIFETFFPDRSQERPYKDLHSIHPFFEDYRPHFVKDDVTYAGITKKEKIQKSLDKTRADGQLAIQSVITSLDRMMWEGALKVVRKKEWGFFYVKGAALEIGSPVKLGGQIALAMTITFNKEKRSMAFEIKRIHEAHKSGFLISASAFFRAGYFASIVDHASKSTGTTHTPPSTLLAIYSTVTEKTLYMGIDASIDGITGVPVDLFNEYENKYSESTLFRLELSGKLHKMIRVQSLILEDFKTGTSQLKAYFLSSACRAIYR